MLRLFVLFTAAVVCTCLGLFSLSSSSRRADLVYVNPSGVHTLDPARMSWIQDFRLALNLWEGLTSWDPRTLLPVGGAAEFPPVVSADGAVYTFTIRGDARWSNGDPLTARDFVRGWRRSLEPGTSADYAFFITDHVEGASDYVDWRRTGAAVLSTLLRLRDGDALGHSEWNILTSPRGRPHWIAALDEPLQSVLERESDEPASIRRLLAEAGVDWATVHRAALARHVRDIEPRFEAVEVRAIDEQTLRVALRRPCPFFLDLTAFPVFLPCHESVERFRESADASPLTEGGLVVYDPQWTKPGPTARGGDGLVTNGPYRLEEWTFRLKVRMAANPHYHSAQTVQCRIVDMLMIENINASLMAYENGQVDLLTDLSAPYAHELVRRSLSGERPDIHLCHVAATYFLNFNCRNGAIDGTPNPLSDVRVREALARSIDKKALVESVTQRGDRVALSFVPPESTPGYQPPTGSLFDPPAARDRLAEAGFPNGEAFPPIALLVTGNDERVATALARMWREHLGVRVAVQTKESKTYGEDKNAGRYFIAKGNWFADYNDPTTFLDCLKSGNGNNDSGYSNADYDDLLERASREPDPSKRFDLLRSAEERIVSLDFPIAPLFHFTEPIAVKPHVEGVYPNARHWYPFRHAKVRQ